MLISLSRNVFNGDEAVQDAISKYNGDSEKIRTWLNRNFRNWAINKGPAYQVIERNLKKKDPDWAKEAARNGDLYRLSLDEFDDNLDLIVDYLRYLDGQDKNFDRLSVPDALIQQEEYHEELANKDVNPDNYEEDGIEDYLEVPPYKWLRITGKKSLVREGDLMGHCVGGYYNRVAAGTTQIYSLRDGKNLPHVTIEIDAYRNSNNKKLDHVEQIKGKANGQVLKKYCPAVHAFLISRPFGVIDLDQCPLSKKDLADDITAAGFGVDKKIEQKYMRNASLTTKAKDAYTFTILTPESPNIMGYSHEDEDEYEDDDFDYDADKSRFELYIKTSSNKPDSCHRLMYVAGSSYGMEKLSTLDAPPHAIINNLIESEDSNIEDLLSNLFLDFAKLLVKQKLTSKSYNDLITSSYSEDDFVEKKISESLNKVAYKGKVGNYDFYLSSSNVIKHILNVDYGSNARGYTINPNAALVDEKKKAYGFSLTPSTLLLMRNPNSEILKALKTLIGKRKLSVQFDASKETRIKLNKAFGIRANEVADYTNPPSSLTNFVATNQKRPKELIEVAKHLDSLADAKSCLDYLAERYPKKAMPVMSEKKKSKVHNVKLQYTRALRYVIWYNKRILQWHLISVLYMTNKALASEITVKSLFATEALFDVIKKNVEGHSRFVIPQLKRAMTALQVNLLQLLPISESDFLHISDSDQKEAIMHFYKVKEAKKE